MQYHIKEAFMSSPVYTHEYVESVRPVTVKPEKVRIVNSPSAVCGWHTMRAWL